MSLKGKYLVDDKKHNGELDFDPEPIFMDRDDDDLLPSERGERLGNDIVAAISEELQGTSEQDDDEDKLWYVIHCYSGQENKVCHSIEQRIETMNMQDRIFDVVVPTEEEIEVKEGKNKFSVEPNVP